MRTLVRHIETLLSEHDCVIVPDFGGLVAHRQPARYDEPREQFIAPQKEVVFNASLNYNDGLLAQSYMQTGGVTYAEANALIANGVKKIREQLQQNRQLQIGKIGCLQLDESNNLQFFPAHFKSLFAESYGLEDFSCEKLIQKKAQPQEPNIAQRLTITPPTKIWLVAAAATLLLLLIPTGSFHHSKHTVNRASVSPFTVWEPSEAPNFSESGDTLAVVVADTVAVAADTVVAVAMPPAVSYHVIIASFPAENSAYRFINEVDGKLVRLKPFVISQDEKYRVSVVGFGEKPDAESFLSGFRTDYPQFSSAWILKVRP